MITSHARLLNQLHEYVDQYVDYLAVCADTPTMCADVNADLRRIIGELEALQAHPDQKAEAERLTRRIGDQLAHLRMLEAEARPRRARLTPQKRTLIQSFQEYINSEVEHLARVSGGTRRDQTNALLADIIADLKALALHPTDEQALILARDLETKREQLQKLQRPWQQMLGQREV